MEATFSITTDVPRGLMRITMAGFYEPDDIARFVAARDQAFTAMRTRPNEHLTLVDIRGMDIQPSESVAEFQRVLADPGRESRRIAFVVARSLSSMQIRRAAHGRAAGYFTDLHEAETWLLAAVPMQQVAHHRRG